ncbi:MAG: NAD(P)-dependent oxidoreductase [Anaerolineae bacterium]|jgi:phosphoglycerate dehydrogenase-like enzyme
MTKQERALITAEFDPAAVARLEDMGYDVVQTGWGQTRQALTAEELAILMDGVSLLIVEVEQVTAEVIAAAPNLEIIATCRAGPVNVDVAAATARGIPVLATPARNADSVADFALGLMLALCRNISRAERHLRQKGWLVQGKEIPYFHFRGPEIAGKTLGLIGCGAIGRALARRVQGFDMRVLVSDPYLDPAVLADLGQLASLETVLAEADFVSLHVPVTQETRGLLDADRLALLKPTAYLINTARAAVIDEDALFDALASKRLAGAALDVFWDEPEMDPRWFSLDNVLLTPHLGGAADDVKIHQSAMIVTDLWTLQDDGAPARLANPEVVLGRQ